MDKSLHGCFFDSQCRHCASNQQVADQPAKMTGCGCHNDITTVIHHTAITGISNTQGWWVKPLDSFTQFYPG